MEFLPLLRSYINASRNRERGIGSQISSSGSDRDLMRLLNPGQMRGLLNKTLVVGEGETALSFVDIVVYCWGVQV